MSEILRVTHWADVCLVLGPSVKYVVPALLLKRPIMVSHAAPFDRVRRPMMARVQYLASWLASLTLPVHAPSLSMWQNLPRRRIHFANPYDPDCFRNLNLSRDGDLLYVGRLAVDKGVDTLLHALATLRNNGRSLRLTIVGKGTHEPELRRLEQDLGLVGAIDWHGLAYGAEVAGLMNRHRILVVPSRWHEPFGIVALEGLACGCKVVVSRHGGLPEAAGKWGYLFENGDAESLFSALMRALDAPDLAGLDQELLEHLADHRPKAVAERYLKCFGFSASE
jgi:glycosyltransferase involved in cell wall biosynthesis